MLPLLLGNASNVNATVKLPRTYAHATTCVDIFATIALRGLTNSGFVSLAKTIQMTRAEQAEAVMAALVPSMCPLCYETCDLKAWDYQRGFEATPRYYCGECSLWFGYEIEPLGPIE